MKSAMSIPKRILVVAGILFWLSLLPSLSNAATVMVQTVGKIHSINTDFSTIKVGNISVLVTNPVDGSPTTNLGPSSLQTGLPSGWTLKFWLIVDPVTGSNLSCSVLNPNSVYQFQNQGNGIYTFLLSAEALSCASASGELHYVIELNVTVAETTYRGSGLGSF